MEKRINEITEFENRAEIYLKEQVRKLNRKFPNDKWSGKLSDHDFSSPWQRDRMNVWMSSRLDRENKFHGKTPGCCILTTQNIRDEEIFEALRRDLMYLYDPCVAERFWKAINYGDEEFFRDLVKNVFGQFVHAKKATRHNNNILKNFLYELDRLSIVTLNPWGIEQILKLDDKNLVDADKEQVFKEECEKAYSIVQEIIRIPEPMKKIPFENALHSPSGFLKKCRVWFKEKQFAFEGTNEFLRAELNGAATVTSENGRKTIYFHKKNDVVDSSKRKGRPNKNIAEKVVQESLDSRLNDLLPSGLKKDFYKK